MKQHIRLGLDMGQDNTLCRASVAGKYQWLCLDASGSCCIPTALARYTLAGEAHAHDLIGCGLYAYHVLMHLPSAIPEDLASADFSALIREIIAYQSDTCYIPIPCEENALPAPIAQALRTLAAQISGCDAARIQLLPATFSPLYRYFKRSPLSWQEPCAQDQTHLSLMRSFLECLWRNLLACNPDIEPPLHMTVGIPCHDNWLSDDSRSQYLALLSTLFDCEDVSLYSEPQAALLSAASEQPLALSEGVTIDLHGATHDEMHMLSILPDAQGNARLCHVYGAEDDCCGRLIENEMFFLVLQSANLKSTALSPQESELLHFTLRRLRDLPGDTTLSLPLYLKNGDVRHISMQAGALLKNALCVYVQNHPSWLERATAYKHKYWHEIKNINLTCTQAVCAGSVYMLSDTQFAATSAFDGACSICTQQADTRIADGLCRALTDPERKTLRNLIEKSTQNLPALSADTLKSQLEAPLLSLLTAALPSHLQQAILSFESNEIRADQLQKALEARFETDEKFQQSLSQITSDYLHFLTHSAAAISLEPAQARYRDRLVPLTAAETALPLHTAFTSEQILEDAITHLDWETPGKKLRRRALILPAALASLFTAAIEPDDEDYSQEPLDAVSYKPIDTFHTFTPAEIAHMLKLCKNGFSLPKDFSFTLSVRCHHFAAQALHEFIQHLPDRLMLTAFDINQPCL